MIRVWFPNYHTEAHRLASYGANLVVELAKHGIECEYEYRDECKAVLVGGVLKADDYFRKREQIRSFNLPSVHLCWDLYPWTIQEVYHGSRSDYEVRKWKDYLHDLKHCTRILVPSACTVDRVEEAIGRHSTVLLAPVRVFDEPTWEGNYVLDCMRKYPDPNMSAVNQACKELDLPLLETKNALPWDEYKRMVAGCRFMVSGQYEASTGGLSLLEGYALGKPVLLSDSPYHGGRDYFGNNASYFRWNNPIDLRTQIGLLWEMTSMPADPTTVKLNRQWVIDTYSDAVYAKHLACHLKEVALK